ncbi:hypothetical protein ACF0H2_07925 [Serratia marcescens]
MIKIVVYLILAVTIAIIAARVLFRLPDISQRSPQAALPADPAALLPARAAELMAAHPGLSGVVPLVSGHDAFASRLAWRWRKGRSTPSITSGITTPPGRSC